MPDLISILMPVYNAEPFLHECLESIKKQSYQNWELIAIDDFSTDASFKILEEASSFDARIKVFKNTEKGITPALSMAFSSAKGLFTTRMDADDVMPFYRLEQMLQTLKKATGKTVVSGLVEYFSEGEVSSGYLQYQYWLNKNLLSKNPWKGVYRECIIASPCWMVRTEELQSIGGFADLSYPEDYDLVFKWFQHNYTITALNKILLYWREHPERTSRNSEHYAQEAFFKLKAKHFIRNEVKDGHIVLWGTGIKARITAKIFKEVDQDFHWMDLNPEKYPDGIYGQSIHPFSDIEKFDTIKLVVAVYPPMEEMLKMNNYLKRLHLKEGVDYWYF